MWLNLALALLYFASGRLGLSLAHLQQNATLFWPPTGIALAAVILYGWRVAPGVALGAFAVNLAVGTAVLPSAAITFGNTSEAVIGGMVLMRVGFRPTLSRLRDVIVLLVAGALVCTTISASVGVGALLMANALDSADAARVWLTWWLGDAGGALVVTPLVLAAAHGTPAWRKLASFEALTVLGGATIAALFAFASSRSSIALVLVFLPFPFVAWAGLRLGIRGAVASVTLVAIVAIFGTVRGLGPFAEQTAHASLLLLWSYAATVAVLALMLAAAVAEREEAEHELRRSVEKRLEVERSMERTQRLESLGVLAGGVAHDFNNILMVVKLHTDMLRRTVEESHHPQLDAIGLAADRAAELCAQLLAYAGRRSVELKRISWGQLIADVNKLIAVSVPKKVSIRYDVPPRLPDVSGDVGQLSQVLMNLVLNAAEAYGDDVGEVCIEAGEMQLRAADLGDAFHAEAAPGTYAFVAVHDRASGMDEETLARIFDPFFTTKFQGRGLGLAAVLGIVRAHGGVLQVDSTAGEGTSMRVCLPAMSASSAEIVEAPAPEHVAPLTILVADDEESVLSAVTMALRERGHEVIEASSGDAALAAFEREDAIDLALLDVMMPGSSGPEALEKMRAIRPVPAILMSGYDESATPHLEADGFLRKPFAIGELLEHVRDQIDRE